MISIIIVNHNKRDLLRECLDSLKGQGVKDIEVIVIDNASSDRSVEMVSAYYPEVRLIQNARNLLFCKAYNQGIDISKGSFVLCINNDVILDKDYLKEALFSIGLNKEIGMISGKILRMDEKTIDSTGLFLGRNRKAIERGYGKKDIGQYDKPGYVFGASGAAMFLRKSMLLDVRDSNGYFDETFKIYYEDLDLCWRAQKKGWKTYYNPKAVAYHTRGATAVGGVNNKSLKIFPRLPHDLKRKYIKNRYGCIRKNDSLGSFLMNLPFIVIYEIRIWAYLVFDFAFNFVRRTNKV